jgi:hypothetical protein
MRGTAAAGLTADLTMAAPPLPPPGCQACTSIRQVKHQTISCFPPYCLGLYLLCNYRGCSNSVQLVDTAKQSGTVVERHEPGACSKQCNAPFRDGQNFP